MIQMQISIELGQPGKQDRICFARLYCGNVSLEELFWGGVFLDSFASAIAEMNQTHIGAQLELQWEL